MTAPTEYDTTGIDPDIATRLTAAVSPRRFRHCRHVADLAVSLAERWRLDRDQARRAGLLHDIWRDRRSEWVAAADREGIVLPDWSAGDLGLLHGPLGALTARRDFALPLPWANAIAGHTTGRAPHAWLARLAATTDTIASHATTSTGASNPGPTNRAISGDAQFPYNPIEPPPPLGPALTMEDMVIYVADHACEGRHKPQVPHWRKLAHQDLAAAALDMFDELLSSLIQQGKPLWESTVLARNQLLIDHPALRHQPHST